MLFDDKTESGSVGDGATACGPVENEAQDTKVSAAQLAQLVAQTIVVVDLLEEVRLRDLLIDENIRIAFAALFEGRRGRQKSCEESPGRRVARLTYSLLLLTENISEKMDRRYTPSTIFSSTRQF